MLTQQSHKTLLLQRHNNKRPLEPYWFFHNILCIRLILLWITDKVNEGGRQDKSGRKTSGGGKNSREKKEKEATSFCESVMRWQDSADSAADSYLQLGQYQTTRELWTVRNIPTMLLPKFKGCELNVIKLCTERPHWDPAENVPFFNLSELTL